MVANKENLVSLADRTTEEQREIAEMGGVASGVVRKQKKNMRELAKLMLGMTSPQDIKAKMKEVMPGLTDEDLTNSSALLFAQFTKALKGDTKAFEVVRDTSGEKPTDTINHISMEPDTFVNKPVKPKEKKDV